MKMSDALLIDLSDKCDSAEALTERALAERSFAASALQCVDAQILCLGAEIDRLGAEIPGLRPKLSRLIEIFDDLDAATDAETNEMNAAA
jgi:hypothetical protein